MSKLLTPPVWYDKNGNLIEMLTATSSLGSIAIGDEADANGGSTAVGYGAVSDSGSVCVGGDAKSLYGESVVIGSEASSSATGCVTVGVQAKGTCIDGVVIGHGSSIVGSNLIAIGPNISLGSVSAGASNMIQIGNTNVSYTVQFGNKMLLDSIYPVGSIYMSVSPTDPGILFGGTWERWGQGRVPVGVSDTDEDFAAGTTGGAKAASLPYHSHGIFSGSQGPSGVDGFVGGSTSSLQPQNPSGSGADGFLFTIGRTDSRYNSAYEAKTDTAGNIDTSKSNLQPYITCYMWKRIE